MHIMYVDESGDPGNSPLSSSHYILTGLIINQVDWKEALENLTGLREVIFQKYGLKPKIEFHATEIFRTSLEEYKVIKKSERINMLKFYVNEIPKIFSNAKILNICFDKAKHPGVHNYQDSAWKLFLYEYDIYLQKTVCDQGIIICDESNEHQLRNLLRKSRIQYPVPLKNIIEDIVHRKSTLSYFIQTCDIIAHCLYRKEYPKSSLRKHQVESIFNTLEPVLLKEANKVDPLGIVRK